jgi:hypothetical protein
VEQKARAKVTAVSRQTGSEGCYEARGELPAVIGALLSVESGLKRECLAGQAVATVVALTGSPSLSATESSSRGAHGAC